jgi:hypothetical protein
LEVHGKDTADTNQGQEDYRCCCQGSLDIGAAFDRSVTAELFQRSKQFVGY